MTVRVYRQSDARDASIRAHGCGPVAALSGYSFATDGAWEPEDMTVSARFRVEASGASDKEFNARGLTSDELAKSMHAIRATDVRMDLPVQQRSGVKVSELMEQLAREDAGALVAVNYAKVQDAGKGVGSYRGFHWVFVFDPKGGNVQVADPLRNKLVTWPVSLLTKAMETFGMASWGDGRGEAVVIWKARTWRSGYASMKASRDAARNELTATEKALKTTAAQLAACQSGTPDPDALAAARAGGIRDAAAAAGAVK